VGKIAQLIPGGGGHTNAAGCTINLPIQKAKKKMLAIIRKEL
jgi:nanoRNase/pAp phosphatase (c-di-AMP/oligoRNAs hydrolase)